MPKLPVAIILLIACVVVFMIQLAYEPLTDAFLLKSSEAIGRPWTLVTSIFLHGSFEHLFYNMFALALFGFILERIIGSRRFLLLFFASGILASIGSAFFYEASLGASGAIFGIIGALAALRPKMVVWVISVPMPMFVAAIVWMFIDLAGMFMPSGTANAAHIVGLAIGVAYGIMLRKHFKEEKRQRERGPLSDDDLDRWEDEWMKR